VLLWACSCAQPPVKGVVSAIPWGNRELNTYTIFDREGTRLGEAGFGITREETAFVLDRTILIATTQDATRLRLHAESLLPIEEERTITQPGIPMELSVRYEKDTAAITVSGPGAPASSTVKVTEDTYAEGEIPMLLRCVRFDPGKRLGLGILLSLEASVVRAQVRVVGKEKVTTSLGRFDAWKVEVAGGRLGQTFWYQAEPPFRLVQYDDGRYLYKTEEAQ